MKGNTIQLLLLSLAGIYFPARAILFWGWGI